MSLVARRRVLRNRLRCYIIFIFIVLTVFNEMASESAVQQKLLDLCKNTGYNIVQNNGQRIYLPPNQLPRPPKGSEIFIGKLPRNMYEDELIPLFEKIGALYNFRMMMDFSGKNRGFAFACYRNVEDANMAIRKLDKYQVRPNVQIGVYKSVDNCRLFVGNIPTTITSEDLKNSLMEFVEGIVDVILYPDVAHDNLNRGYAFIEFEDHSRAAMARRQLAPASLELFGNAIHVDWAEPLPEVDPDVMAQVQKLYLRNLPLHLSNERLLQTLDFKIGGGYIVKVHKCNNYAFVHFVDRASAEVGFNRLLGLTIEGKDIEVTWARPRSYSRANRENSPPTNFCLSVPPRIRRAMLTQRNGSASTSEASSQNSSPRQQSPPTFRPQINPTPPAASVVNSTIRDIGNGVLTPAKDIIKPIMPQLKATHFKSTGMYEAPKMMSGFRASTYCGVEQPWNPLAGLSLYKVEPRPIQGQIVGRSGHLGNFQASGPVVASATHGLNIHAPPFEAPFLNIPVGMYQSVC